VPSIIQVHMADGPGNIVVRGAMARGKAKQNKWCVGKTLGVRDKHCKARRSHSNTETRTFVDMCCLAVVGFFLRSLRVIVSSCSYPCCSSNGKTLQDGYGADDADDVEAVWVAAWAVFYACRPEISSDNGSNEPSQRDGALRDRVRQAHEMWG